MAVSQRSVPYHLQARVADSLENMIKNGVIEERPRNEPAPWVFGALIVQKDDGSLRVTLNAHNFNKALISTNFPIPKQEDSRAQLSGSKIFSKLDFKFAFWHLELHLDSRYFTFFHANNKLYRYTRLVMGIKPVRCELSASLRPMFGHIAHVFLIHDDLIIATETTSQQLLTPKTVCLVNQK